MCVSTGRLSPVRAAALGCGGRNKSTCWQASVEGFLAGKQQTVVLGFYLGPTWEVPGGGLTHTGAWALWQLWTRHAHRVNHCQACAWGDIDSGVLYVSWAAPGPQTLGPSGPCASQTGSDLLRAEGARCPVVLCRGMHSPLCFSRAPGSSILCPLVNSTTTARTAR